MELIGFDDLKNVDVGKARNKATSITGDQFEASTVLWTSSDGAMEIGVWECSPGRFSADRSASSEFCHIIAGRVELNGPEGNTRTFGPGDALALPLGWKGEWNIIEHTRKL